MDVRERPPPSDLSGVDLVDVGDIGPVVGVRRRFGGEPGVEDLAEHRLRRGAQGLRLHVRVIPARAPAAVPSAHSAALMPGTLFAAMDAPAPVQQHTTAVRHEVARYERTRGLEDRLNVVGSVVPGPCSGPVSIRACVAGNGGVRSPEESPRIPVPSGGHRRGEDRTLRHEVARVEWAHLGKVRLMSMSKV